MILSVMFIALILLIGCSKDDQNKHELSELVGKWTGAIHIPDSPLHVQVSLEHDERWTGLVSIPTQNISDYPFSSVSLTDEKMVMAMELAGENITFEGVFEGDQITGTFHQSGHSFPFRLMRSLHGEGEEDEAGEFVSIKTEVGTLYGELNIPDKDEPHPIVLIIPGSGPTDRNGNTMIGENNSLKFLADQLADHGIASLRFDKRGAGKNREAVNEEELMLFEQYVDDATQWVELLHDDDRFSNVGIIGHSEGSLVGILAAQQSDVDIFVSLAGAGRPIGEVLFDQLSEQLQGDLLEESGHILAELEKGNSVDDVSPALKEVFDPSGQPFLMSWMNYDPTEEVSQFTLPKLMINGDEDMQVPVKDAELLYEAADDAELLIIETMNHILKSTSGDRQENLLTYSHPALPLADGLIDGMVEFFKKNDFVGR